MKVYSRFFVVSLVALVAAGCLEVTTTVKVKPDGSGTVEETVIMGKSMIDQIKSLQSQFQDPSQKQKPFSVIDKDELNKRALQMGPGVKLVSTEKIAKRWGEGYKAVYSFKDVNTLKVQQDPGKKAPSMGQGMQEEEKKEEVMTFRMTKGKPATLDIMITQREWERDTTEQETEEADSASEAMMMEMLKGLRFTSIVEVHGDIKETNASFRDGSKITLVDVDFEKLVADKEKFKQVSKAQPKTLEEAKMLFKDVPGLKFETNQTVTVKTGTR
ncbi:MAG: hypothetical protein HYY49_02945 [Ignavibacteriales bacterium]|nr:hypothetical protein [Ignavibacteriales bacterium]